MNRCQFLRGAATGTLLLALSAAVPAQIIARKFPDNAFRGEISVMQPPQIMLNGYREQLSPGARIRDNRNLMVLSGSLVGQPLMVNYTREMHGLIHEVWLLTDEEIAEKRPKEMIP